MPMLFAGFCERSMACLNEQIKNTMVWYEILPFTWQNWTKQTFKRSAWEASAFIRKKPKQKQNYVSVSVLGKGRNE